jgi:hypothetical protein
LALLSNSRSHVAENLNYQMSLSVLFEASSVNHFSGTAPRIGAVAERLLVPLVEGGEPETRTETPINQRGDTN